MMTLDALDEGLIAALRENARVPAALLARRLSASRTTVQARIDRLERLGVIERYTAVTSEAFEKGLIRAQVAATITPKQSAAVESALRRMPQVRRLHSVSGPFDMIAEIAAPTIGELDAAIDRIGALEGVERTTSSIILSTKIER
jgi:DNA-binding Lrp family transcriptional regulator